MKYINPIKQLNLQIAPSKSITRSELKTAKKKLLAEFEVQQTTTINFANQELDKNAVLQLFEQVESDTVLDFHLQLLEYPLLLQFLETGELAFFEQQEYVDTSNEQFVDFFAPYFAERYNMVFSKALKERDVLKIRSLDNVLIRKLEKFDNDLYKNSLRYLNRMINDFKEVISKGFLFKDVAQYIDGRALEVMKRLPPYFNFVIDRYALTLNDLALAYFNKRNQHEEAIKLIKQGLQLNISESTRAQLQYMRNQMNGILEEANNKSSYGNWVYFIIAWIIFKVLVVAFSS